MKITQCFAIFAVLAALAPGVAAADEAIGHTKIVNGRVVVLRDGVETPVKGGDALFRKDVLITGEDGSAGLSFKDNSRLSLGANSRLTFLEFHYTHTHSSPERTNYRSSPNWPMEPCNTFRASSPSWRRVRSSW